jgi:hypothetical protein
MLVLPLCVCVCVCLCLCRGAGAHSGGRLAVLCVHEKIFRAHVGAFDGSIRLEYVGMLGPYMHACIHRFVSRQGCVYARVSAGMLVGLHAFLRTFTRFGASVQVLPRDTC